MSALEAIVLGVVQGLTEFLPISSTAHLRIVPAFAGWEDPGAAFTAVVQLGTTAAVLIFFRRELWRIGRAWLRSLADAPMRRHDPDARIDWFIVLGTIPIGIFGLAFKDQIESGARSLWLIGTALIVVGFVLLRSEKVGARNQGRIEGLSGRDAAAIGVAQAFALVPGVSRSGATISAGLFRGLERADAARYSFLLSIPAIVLSGLFELYGILDEKRAASLGALAVATFMAFVVGYASIAFLLRFLTSHTTRPFVSYRVGLGVLVLVLTATGAIS